MKKIYHLNKNLNRLTQYSAMAACLLAIKSVDGQVVYEDIDDVVLEASEAYDVFDLDLDADGTLDFHFRAGSIAADAWTFASIFGSYPDLGVGNASNLIIGYAGTNGYSFASAFEEGVLIGPEGDFLPYPSSSAVLVSNYGGEIYGPFPGAGDRYLGIQFKMEDSLHYGWIRVQVEVDPVVLTIKDYAYADIANASINTGDTVLIQVGLNETIDDEDIVAYSFGKTIHILNSNTSDISMEVNVLNIGGENVYKNLIDQSNLTIDMREMPSGIYTVQILAGDAMHTKKLLIVE